MLVKLSRSDVTPAEIEVDFGTVVGSGNRAEESLISDAIEADDPGADEMATPPPSVVPDSLISAASEAAALPGGPFCAGRRPGRVAERVAAAVVGRRRPRGRAGLERGEVRVHGLADGFGTASAASFGAGGGGGAGAENEWFAACAFGRDAVRDIIEHFCLAG